MVYSGTELVTESGDTIKVSDLLKFLRSAKEFKDIHKVIERLEHFEAVALVSAKAVKDFYWGDKVNKDDPRLSDAREAKPHRHRKSDIEGIENYLSKDEASKLLADIIKDLKFEIDKLPKKSQKELQLGMREIRAELGAKISGLEKSLNKPQDKPDFSRVDKLESQLKDMIGLVDNVIDKAEEDLRDVQEKLLKEMAERIKKDGNKINIIGGINTGEKFKLLKDTDVDNVTNNQIARYDSTAQKWKNTSILAGSNVTITQNADDITISASGGGGGSGTVDTVVGTTNQIDVDATDAANPIVSLASAVTTSLGLADSALQSGDNVSELVNDSGYLTSYTETDTLQTVTDRGATTTNTVTLSPSGDNKALVANGSGSGIGIDITHAGSGAKLKIGTAGAGDLIDAGSFNVDNAGNIVGNNLSGTNTGDQDLSGYLLSTTAATTYQPLDAGLTSISGLTTAADRMIYTTASDTYATTVLTSFARTLLDDTTQATARTTLGLGTGDSPQFTAVNIGNATDTTLTRVSAGVAAIEGQTIATASNSLALTNKTGNISQWTNDSGYTTNIGTVTSVTVSGSDGIEVDSGSPVTTSGTIALGVNKAAMLSTLNVEDGADVTDSTNVLAALTGQDINAASLTTTGAVVTGGNIDVNRTGTFAQLNLVSDNTSGSVALVDFVGDNSSASAINYARILTQVVDSTAGSEDGSFEVWTEQAGTLTKALDITTQADFSMPITATSINFGDDTLDTYNEADTYSPTLYGTSTAGTPVYSTRSGTFTRIGNVVFYTIFIAINADLGGMAGNIRVQLPQTVSAAGGTATIGACSGYSVAAGKSITADINPSTDYIRLRQSDENDTSTNIAIGNITTSFILEVGGFYFV